MRFSQTAETVIYVAYEVSCNMWLIPSQPLVHFPEQSICTNGPAFRSVNMSKWSNIPFGQHVQMVQFSDRSTCPNVPVGSRSTCPNRPLLNTAYKHINLPICNSVRTPSNTTSFKNYIGNMNFT